MSEEKLVPKLRFNGFEDEWKEINLADISTDKDAIIAGPFGSNLKVEDYTDYGQPLIRLQNIERSKFLKKDLKYVSDEKAIELKHHSFIPGDIVFSKLGNPIGKTCRIPFDFPKGIVVADVVRIRPDEKHINSDFLVELLNANNVRRQIGKETIGSTRTRLNLTQVRNLQITIPSLNEQNKIIKFLANLNRKLELLEEKHEYYQDFKKYLMQQIFAQKLRFEDEENWKTVKLGDICKIKTGKLDANAMVENGKYRFYTCAKEYYFIDDYAYDTEALLISGNGAHVGYIHYYNGKFNAYQRTYILDQFTENIKLIMYILNKSLKKRIQQEKNEGSTPYIKLSTLKDMKIDIPQSKTEQEKITSLFTDINNKLEYIDVELKNMQNFKKGLLQQMFV